MRSREASPTARALRTLELLHASPGISADRLAQRLGVTDRAARRYIAILREAGIPVESSRGPYGGYRVGSGLRLPPLVFTATEALGLVMAVLDGNHAAADPEDPVGAGLGKLIRALPEAVGRQAAMMRENALAAPNRNAARPDPATTSDLVAAIAAQRRARISYRSASGSQWETDVDPWAVVVRYGRWYLLCHAHDVDAVRTFRIDRIQSVVTLGDGFQPLEGLDAVTWLEQHLGTGWKYRAHVIFEAHIDDIAPYITPPMGRLEPIDGGARCAVIGSTSNPAMYAGERLAAIPFPFHVKGGPELREAVADVARRMATAVRAAGEEAG
jgi:predicted DNA-binding transcriptional regulator YafY